MSAEFHKAFSIRLGCFPSYSLVNYKSVLPDTYIKIKLKFLLIPKRRSLWRRMDKKICGQYFKSKILLKILMRHINELILITTYCMYILPHTYINSHLFPRTSLSFFSVRIICTLMIFSCMHQREWKVYQTLYLHDENRDLDAVKN